jgi:hypothetical protein
MDDEPQSQPGPRDEKGGFDQLGDRAREAGAAVKDMAQDASTRGAALAGEVAGSVKDQVLSAAEEGKDGIAGRLEDMAGAVHRSGEELEGQQDWLAQLVERGADELGNLASTVRSNDLRGLIGKLQDMARRQPVLFVGAAMAAGFASARIGKVALAGASRSDLPTIKDVENEPK